MENNTGSMVMRSLALPKHMIWGLLFLKQYNPEAISAGIAGVNEKTFRKWSWFFIEELPELKMVRRVK